MNKRLNRQGSKQSVRSVRTSHSVNTPQLTRKQVGAIVKQSPIEVKVMPSLKKQLNEKQPKEEEEIILFDEEREQQLLEEAKKKKERAKKMREQ